MNSTLKLLQESGRCKTDEPLKFHTTWGVGGNAKIFVLPQSLDELVEIVDFCNTSGIYHKVIGNGSNLLFSDKGFDGMIISTRGLLSNISHFSNTITASAGENLSAVCAFAQKKGLSGLEWACGIPGTIGGAVVQNAGAFGKDISMVVSKVLTFSQSSLETKTNNACQFAYRSSCFKEQKDVIILDACFVLKKDDPVEIKNRMKMFASRRIASQPVGRSAGSVFLSQNGLASGYLIEAAGLKGTQIGGAKVSEKHANFIINTGNATASDIYNLICEVQSKVYEKFGLWLKTEVEIVGDF